MKILFCNWVTFGDRDIVDAMNALGHRIYVTDLKPEKYKNDDKFFYEFSKLLSTEKPNIVFTSNYAPVVSESCMKMNVKYMSWVYDSPQILLYDKSIFNTCNYVFLFDRQQYEEMRNLGIETVYYMPLAVNPKRLRQLINFNQQPDFENDIAFVGTLYNEDHNFFDRMERKLDNYTKGYLYGLMNAQRNVYGYFFMDEILNNNPLVEQMYKALPYDVGENSFATREYVYGHYFLGRKLATIERIDLIKNLARQYKLAFYTTGDTSEFPEIDNKGTADYYDKMPLVFNRSKINLNITLRTIRSGMPLRALDIMGCGGFLLTNYQADFMDYFVPGEDFVYYESKQDLFDKVDYYLTHEDERMQIAESGCRKVQAEHTYEIRLKEMLEILADETSYEKSNVN